MIDDPPYPFLVSRACVLSSHLPHGLSLPNCTDRVRIYLQIGKKGGALVGEAILKGAGILGGGTSRAMEVVWAVWRQIPRKKNVAVCVRFECRNAVVVECCDWHMFTVSVQGDPFNSHSIERYILSPFAYRGLCIQHQGSIRTFPSNHQPTVSDSKLN
jgi:hypothetical protein